ncbi:unnamed protein product [Microthlaspi erraticum]|uniref:Jacalin-type lectin domain-containing protein n=1 Tax=Microthlaspi erraticum TaxID=1685480 RepID=A0A6D2JA80_9BRAS|nr:unnamed protein product [Microthlaspi erraticum]
MFIDGYYNETSGVIQGLQFKTNMKTSELMGCYDDETDTKFSLGSNSNKIIGFHGYAEKYLNSIGAYSTSLPLTRGDLCHNNDTGYVWDDGTFQGVRKVYVYHDDYSMRCVRFDYDNNGKVESREHGSKAAVTFVLDYPTEFLTSVEGTSVYRYPQSRITSFIFKTSKGRASPIFGNAFSDDQLVKFVLEKKGCAFVGFHGRSLSALLNALGAYFLPMPPPQDGEKLEE